MKVSFCVIVNYVLLGYNYFSARGAVHSEDGSRSIVQSLVSSQCRLPVIAPCS